MSKNNKRAVLGYDERGWLVFEDSLEEDKKTLEFQKNKKQPLGYDENGWPIFDPELWERKKNWRGKNRKNRNRIINWWDVDKDGNLLENSLSVGKERVYIHGYGYGEIRSIGHDGLVTVRCDNGSRIRVSKCNLRFY